MCIRYIQSIANMKIKMIIYKNPAINTGVKGIAKNILAIMAINNNI